FDKSMSYIQHMDGWSNFFTGIGVQGVDRKMATTFSAKSLIPENVLRNLYRGDGLAKRIIELPTLAMLRRGFEVEGDPDAMVVARLEETKIMKNLEELVRWSRLFGGALGVLGADDGS